MFEGTPEQPSGLLGPPCAKQREPGAVACIHLELGRI
jgi:hypothetical protein